MNILFSFIISLTIIIQLNKAIFENSVTAAKKFEIKDSPKKTNPNIVTIPVIGTTIKFVKTVPGENKLKYKIIIGNTPICAAIVTESVS